MKYNILLNSGDARHDQRFHWIVETRVGYTKYPQNPPTEDWLYKLNDTFFNVYLHKVFYIDKAVNASLFVSFNFRLRRCRRCEFTFFFSSLNAPVAFAK